MTKPGVFFLKYILIPFLLVVPFLILIWPLIGAGIQNGNMIRYFDSDEYDLVEFSARTYAHGLIPLEYLAAYPQLFYYLGGIVLFPLTFFNGVDMRVIAMCLRGLNFTAAIASMLFLYYFVLRFYKSLTMAILASSLFITTPQIVGFMLNSRPHLLSVFFTLAMFYYCFKATQDYKPYFARQAVVFNGFAAATNFFGFLNLPALWITNFYHLFKMREGELSDFIHRRKAQAYGISALIFIVSLAIPLAAIAAFFKFPKWFHGIGIFDLRHFLDYRNFKILILFSLALFLAAALCAIFNFISLRVFKRWIALTSAALTSGFFVFFIVFFLFLLLNPYYIFFPLLSVKATVLQIASTSMGSRLNAFVRPVFDPAGFILWFKMLFDNNLLNIWFGLLLMPYLIYETVNFKNNWKNSRDEFFQRFILWSNCIFVYLVLSICVSHRPHHYFLQVSAILGVLLSWGLVKSIRQLKARALKTVLLCAYSILLFLGFHMRVAPLANFYRFQKGKSADIALTAGKWLEDHYGAQTGILKLGRYFYLPPRFQKVFYVTDTAGVNQIMGLMDKNQLQVMVLPENSGADLKLISAAGFSLVREFKGSFSLDSITGNPAGKERMIYIYARKGV